MDPSDVWLLIVLLMLIYLSSFFSASETALTTVNRHRLRSLAENGNRKAALVLEMLEEQGKMLTTILIGNNIVNLSASALATVLANKIGGNLAVGIGTGLLTLVILIFGEISPKDDRYHPRGAAGTQKRICHPFSDDSSNPSDFHCESLLQSVSLSHESKPE